MTASAATSERSTRTARVRFPAMALALAALALGLWAGLDLIGWRLTPLTSALLGAHGVLMVNGVLATLIGLERAVALRRRLFVLVPVVTAVGAIALALGGNAPLSWDLLLVGALGLLLLFGIILSLQPALYTVTMLLGTVSLVVGDALGPAVDVPHLIPWWASFLVLVVAAERLELSRVVPQTAYNRALFAFTVALSLAGATLSTVAFAAGFMVAAAGWFLVAVWLLFHDIARRNLGRAGLPRFTALALLPGFGWLLLGAGIILVEGGVVLGLVYDAALHAIFLGFVLSLVFGHALIIVPADLGRPLAVRSLVYVPLGILHVSLAARIYADLVGDALLREWGGLFNVAAIVLFGLLLPALAVPRRPGKEALAEGEPVPSTS